MLFGCPFCYVLQTFQCVAFRIPPWTLQIIILYWKLLTLTSFGLVHASCSLLGDKASTCMIQSICFWSCASNMYAFPWNGHRCYKLPSHSLFTYIFLHPCIQISIRCCINICVEWLTFASLKKYLIGMIRAVCKS
jgi:hypothetical protein